MLVSILDGRLLLDERDCRTIERHDGGLAAIWRGQAFPLLPDGKSIDVSQEGWSPSELALIKPREAPPAYALLENKDSVYVLLSGSVTDREAAVSRLKLASIEVERAGRYLGVPVAGMDCDWYMPALIPLIAFGMCFCRTRRRNPGICNGWRGTEAAWMR